MGRGRHVRFAFLTRRRKSHAGAYVVERRSVTLRGLLDVEGAATRMICLPLLDSLFVRTGVSGFTDPANMQLNDALIKSYAGEPF